MVHLADWTDLAAAPARSGAPLPGGLQGRSALLSLRVPDRTGDGARGQAGAAACEKQHPGGTECPVQLPRECVEERTSETLFTKQTIG